MMSPHDTWKTTPPSELHGDDVPLDRVICPPCDGGGCDTCGMTGAVPEEVADAWRAAWECARCNEHCDDCACEEVDVGWTVCRECALDARECACPDDGSMDVFEMMEAA